MKKIILILCIASLSGCHLFTDLDGYTWYSDTESNSSDQIGTTSDNVDVTGAGSGTESDVDTDFQSGTDSVAIVATDRDSQDGLDTQTASGTDTVFQNDVETDTGIGADSDTNTNSDSGKDSDSYQLPDCSAIETLCVETRECIDLATNEANCGECGHDCGVRSSCSQGKCQPALLVDELSSTAGGMDVSSKGIFFATSGTIQYCSNPIACVGATEQLGSLSAVSSLAVTRTLSTDLIGFLGKILPSNKVASFYHCNTTSCSAPTSLSGGPGTGGTAGDMVGFGGDLYYMAGTSTSNPETSKVYRVIGMADGSTEATVVIGDHARGTRLVVDSQYVYFERMDDDGNPLGVVACNRLTGCSGYTPVTSENVKTFTALDGALYWMSGFALNYTSVTEPNEGATVATLSTAYYGEMLIDSDNLYFSTDSRIVYCELPRCAGGEKILVSGLSSPSNLRLESDYLYWLADSNTTIGAAAIYRVAKP
ncbi:MAG: hypothetical protein JXR76_22375 [Deltaproteobacteria bacterium]|nr:hypothetical protein [Deltaproteobacteria bacterium]